MNISSHIFFICIVFLNLCNIVISECNSCYMHHDLRKTGQKFHQKSNRFWEFDQISKTWVEIKLPFDLVSCVNDNCTVVDSIQELNGDKRKVDDESQEKITYPFLRVRKRLSLTRMSETSIWVTGQSGSVYERFWNGMQWVIAPHDLPISAGYAVSVFIVKQTILALSDTGLLFQMQLTVESQPYWVEFMPDFDREPGKESEQISDVRFSTGVVSNDMETMYFCTKRGSLVELHGIDPPRWINHGQPPGANVAAITDANNIRSGVIYILSGAGGLYEYDKASKPSWKKHIHIHAPETPEKDNLLAPVKGCTLLGLSATYSASIFLLTKGGELIERRLQQRKWKWRVHGSPNGHPLSSITCTSQDGNSNSLYLTSTTGFIFEYQIPKYSGSFQNQQLKGNWLNHNHPPHAKLARSISGLQIQVGRMIFPLDDGRLAELHLSGFGGENFGPFSPTNTKRKSPLKYVWSIIESPESEGWNAEYCTEEPGPANCILGTKDQTVDSRWRKNAQNYLVSDINGSLSNSDEDYKLIKSYFRLRRMQEGKSFFLITDDGSTFEYLNTENVWFWLKHEHSTTMGGVVGNYNGILFMVDENGNLFIRERSGNELAWINCTTMKKGKQVIGGPPWDVKISSGKPEDGMFFISKTGKLLQFTVALRKFKWKDCKNPLGTRIASIADQEGFREKIVFVIGRNGRLYQYNKVTEVWHEHYQQSQHLVLKISPGTTMRSRSSLKGSIFMLSEEGGLVEYRWRSVDGWSWIEHGTPYTNVTLVGAPGPALGEEVFLVGSDGNVHMRYLDRGEWKWKDFGFPHYADFSKEDDIYGHCNPKVTCTRAIPFSENSVIFELLDGRLGEMQKMEGKYWAWSRTIGTPTSLCMANFWTTLA